MKHVSEAYPSEKQDVSNSREDADPRMTPIATLFKGPHADTHGGQATLEIPVLCKSANGGTDMPPATDRREDSRAGGQEDIADITDGQAIGGEAFRNAAPFPAGVDGSIELPNAPNGTQRIRLGADKHVTGDSAMEDEGGASSFLPAPHAPEILAVLRLTAWKTRSRNSAPQPVADKKLKYIREVFSSVFLKRANLPVTTAAATARTTTRP